MKRLLLIDCEQFVGVFGLFAIILSACLASREQAPVQVSHTLLALGDSYTMGTGVNQSESWPAQLTAALKQRGFAMAEPLVIARNGWTTLDLASGIQAASPQGPFYLVILLIGANDQFRGYAVEDYRLRFAALLPQAIAYAGAEPERVVVLSIPDWGQTPFAQGRETALISSQIDAYNNANQEAARKAGVNYVDVTTVSRRAAEEPDLLAPDQLHPSAKMYALWVEKLLPLAETNLRKGR